MAKEEDKEKPRLRYQMGKRSQGWKDTIQFKKPEQSNSEKKE